VDDARAWLEPALLAWPARWLAGRRGGRDLQARVNDLFALERLRPMPLTDMDAVSPGDTDFDEHIGSSVLPLWLDLARAHGLRLCFVRTQRRIEGGLRPETPALRRYMRRLGAFIAARGGYFVDDQHDPAVTALPYDDLDHLSRSARVAYTDLLAVKLRALDR
jgi:hypothetical protein